MTFRVDTDLIRQQIDNVRDVIGRPVIVHTARRDPCSICLPGNYYDAKSDSSFNIKCPECKGKYWLSTTNQTEVLARVHWVQDEGITATPGGKYFLGDAQLTVAPEYAKVFEQAQFTNSKVVVDSNEMQILRISPMGTPTINRYRIILRGMGDRPKE